MTTYQICDANGYALTDGLTKDEAYRIAQTKADDRGESVWVSESDSEDMGDEIAATTVRCACGQATGVQCEWTGPRAETVVVEWMPMDLRASHEAAGNDGVYPHNGALRLRVTPTCATMLADDEDA